MTTRIGTLETEIEVLPEPSPGSTPTAGSAILDERSQMRQQLRREQAIVSRTRAEGFDD